MNPRNTKSLSRYVEVTSELSLTKDTFIAICKHLAHDRPFDLIVNNCQRWCSEVLMHLVHDGWITQAHVDALTEKGFTPLVGTITGC